MSRNLDRAASLLAALNDDDRITLRRASDILDLSYPSLVRYHKKGWIRTFQIGNRTFVTVKELKRFNKYGNYDASSPESDPTNGVPLHPDEEAKQPLPIKTAKDGSIDLSELTPEQRDRLGTPLPTQTEESHYD